MLKKAQEKMSNNLPVIIFGACVVGITSLAIRYFSAGPRRVFLEQGDKSEFIPLKLIRKQEISPDTRIFRFALEHPNQVLGLPIGQHMMLRATINGQPVTRSYTPISSNEDLGYVEFIIKIYKSGVHPKFPNGGKMSQHLDNLRIGETIDVKGPTGKFDYKGHGQFKLKSGVNNFVARTVKRMGMIAGGSGITPMLQLIRAILNNPHDKTEISLIFANQTEADILMRRELEECVKEHPTRFKLWYTLSRVDDKNNNSSSWKYSIGYIDFDMVSTHLPAPDPHTVILMCGPLPMIQNCCKPHLEKMGFQAEAMIAF